MSTFMANKGNIERKWYVIDAAGKPLGKTAATGAASAARQAQDHLHPMLTAAITSSSSTRQGRSDRQEAGAEVLSHPLRLDRRSEGDPVQDPDEEKPELAMKLAVQGMLPEYHRRAQAPDPSEDLRRASTSSRLRSPKWKSKKEEEKNVSAKKPYLYGTGRRKSSVARVRLFPTAPARSPSTAVTSTITSVLRP